MFNGQFLNGVDCFRVFNFFEKSKPEFFQDGFYVKLEEVYSNVQSEAQENENPDSMGSFPPWGGINDFSARVWYKFYFHVFKFNNVTNTWETYGKKWRVYYARLIGVKNTKNWKINLEEYTPTPPETEPQEVG